MDFIPKFQKYSRQTFYVILIFINLVLLVPEVGSFTLGIIRNINRDGMWRSAKFANSSNLADYLEFLKQEIPEDAVVIIPPEEVSSWALSDSPAMQFFLAPREIKNCTTIDCGTAFLDKENTYTLIMGLNRFPGDIVEGRHDNIRMYNDTWGVFGSFQEQEAISDQANTGGTATKYGFIFLQIFSVVLFLLMGYIATNSLLPDNPPWLNLGLGYGLLLGTYSFLGYLVMYFELITSPKSILFLFAGLSILISIWIIINDKARFSHLRLLFNRNVFSDYWLLLIIIFGLGFSFFSIGSGFAGTDAHVLWGPKAVGIIVDGLPGVVTRGTNTTIYPLHIPMMLAMLLDAFGDTLPAAKIIFPLYYFSLILIFYEYLKKNFGNPLSGLSTIVLATMPLIARHARLAYANLPLTYYLVVGVILILTASSYSDKFHRRVLLALAGIFMAFSVWTRPEGIYLAFAIVLIGIFYSAKINKSSISQYLWLIIPPVILTLIWKLTSRHFYLGVAEAESSLILLVTNFSQGIYKLDNISAIILFLLKELFNYQTWGVIGLGLIAAVMFGLYGKRNFIPGSSMIFLAAATLISIVIAMYYVLPLYGNPDVYWWLGSGFNRMILPGVSLLWLGVSWVINSPATAVKAD